MLFKSLLDGKIKIQDMSALSVGFSWWWWYTRITVQLKQGWLLPRDIPASSLRAFVCSFVFPSTLQQWRYDLCVCEYYESILYVVLCIGYKFYNFCTQRKTWEIYAIFSLLLWMHGEYGRLDYHILFVQENQPILKWSSLACSLSISKPKGSIKAEVTVITWC